MKQAVIVAFGLIALLAPVTAQADPITDPSQLSAGFTLVDFESIDTGGNLVTAVPNPFTLGDLTFTSLTGNLSIFDITISGAWGGVDGTEVASKTLFPGGEPDSAIAIAFARPVAEFLLGWGDPSFNGNILRAFDVHGKLLEEAAVPFDSAGGSAAWAGFKRPKSDIAMILVQPDQTLPSGDDYVIDNIYYNTATAKVPEPSSLLLLGTGLAATVAARRRRFQ